MDSVKVMKMINLPKFPSFSKTHFHISNHSSNSKQLSTPNCYKQTTENSYGRIGKMVQEFNPRIPIDEAWTPPSCWYTDPDFYSFELHHVFYKGWQAVGYTEQIKEPRDYFTGRLGSIEYVVCLDEQGELRAFHNVCRHHASLIASGAGKSSCFVCPYHGWTYGLDGRLSKATRITGIKNFKVHEMGLVPLKVDTWGPFVLINPEGGSKADTSSVSSEWLGSAAEILSSSGIDTSLEFLCRRVYTLECNWKVFCDNYLDGGYHVPYAHKGLASGLQLDSYSTNLYEKVSIQSCGGNTLNSEEFDRLGSEAVYAFVYPNFMINRYGPWMDTNLVLPLGPSKCQVIFDYFLDPSLKDDTAFIERSLKDSERVQIEDIALCRDVQKGLESPAYNVGRYSPNVEMAMHHFHCKLHGELMS